MNFNALLALGPVLAQVLIIDLVLAGDNAVVIGLAVNDLPPAQRRRAIWLGSPGPPIIRIGFGLVALKLLALIGLTLAGGIALVMGGLENRAGAAPGGAHAAGPARWPAADGHLAHHRRRCIDEPR